MVSISSRRASEPDHAARDMMNSAELVLIDLDGCLAFGDDPHPAASALLMQLGSRYAILSNNSTETPASLAKNLRSCGLAVDPSRIILAGALMIDILAADRRHRSIALFAAPEIENYAISKGLQISLADDAGLVALARDTSFTYDKLQRGVALLAGGAEFVVSNPDLTHPGRGRVPVPETGSLLKMFQACMPDVIPEIIGKPGAIMFETALRRFGGAAGTTIMIGDNPMTDGLGAERAGICSLLVGPGNPYESIAALIK
jgi:HAD superfamily hydrolase (TIGR01450 family)